ncbi:MAG: ribonuclease D [Gammaproteobacteria bacterium]|nr:MAG: ribonuclease D [Gammaproteobacteria bacterium]
MLWIDTADALTGLCNRLAQSPWLCLDTEFLREKTYRPQLCLIQVADADTIACIDPLAIDDLEPLNALLRDERITKVLHSASQDLEIFAIREGFVPAPVFDTQVAAALMGMGDQVGYGRLVEEMLGVQLDKAHSRTDWTRRPLSRAQIEYAADDVRWLRKIYLRQQQWLTERGRLDWLQADFAALTDPARYQPDPEAAWLRVKGIQRLRPAQLAVLRELAAWREREAVASDRPRRWILKDEVLIDLARRRPKNESELADIRGLETRTIQRHGRVLLELIESASALPREEWPALPERKRLQPRQEAIIDLLMASLRQSALEAEISPQAIAGRKDLERLVLGERALPLLRGWRKELVGERLLDLIEGRSALGIDAEGLVVVPRGEDR